MKIVLEINLDLTYIWFLGTGTTPKGFFWVQNSGIQQNVSQIWASFKNHEICCKFLKIDSKVPGILTGLARGLKGRSNLPVEDLGS